MSKKWKCPECENLTETLECVIDGTVTIDVNDNVVDKQWETGYGICTECGYTKKWPTDNYFEVVEVSDE